MIPAIPPQAEPAGCGGRLSRSRGNKKEKDKGRGIHDTNEGA